MTYVIAAPEIVAAAASDLTTLGSTLNGATTAAAPPTTGVLAAGADEVSEAVANLFRTHAKSYQALSARRRPFIEQFVQALKAGAGAYAGAEAANVSPLQAAENHALAAVNEPAMCCSGVRSSATAPTGYCRAPMASPAASWRATAEMGPTASPRPKRR